jgi:hypothetical protein
MNTGKEVEETLVFLHEMETRWPINLVWLEWDREYCQDEDKPWFKIVDFHTASRNSEPFEKMMKYYEDFRREEKGLGPILPNFSNKMCSSYLKTKVMEKWMKSLGYKEWDSIIGIRYDEPNRYNLMMAANEKGGKPWEAYLPLYLDRVDHQQVKNFWATQPFDLGIDSDLGNCDLCWKKHENKIYRAMIKNPESADWWIKQEQRTGQQFRLDRNYKTMFWISQQMAKQGTLPFYSEEEDSIDCACTN